MSIRWKLFIVIAMVAIVVVGAVIVIAEYTFVKGLEKIENNGAIQMAQRAESSLSDQIEGLNTLNHDWAAWDDTYNFVQHPAENDNYVQSNPTDTTFASARLNFLFIINLSNQIVYSKGFDLDSGQQVPIPASLSQQAVGPTFTFHESVDDKLSGLVSLPEGPLLVSALPILTSNGEGPVEGTIIMARFVDAKVVDAMSNSLHLPVAVLNPDEAHIPADFAAVRSLPSAKTSEIAQTLSAQTIAGYALISDIYGKPALIIRVEIPRDIYAAGLTTTRYFIIFLIVIALIFGSSMFLLIGKLVISRLKQVGDFVGKISTSGDLSSRLFIKGKDELSTLGKDVNDMVESLEKSQELLKTEKRAEERLRLTIESVAEGIATTDIMGSITDANDSKVLLHGYSKKAEIIGKSVLDLIAQEDRSKAETEMKKTLESGDIATSEYTMLKKDGSQFFGERSAALFRSPDGLAVGFVISTKDVTERKKAEETLKASEAQFRNLVENAAAGILITLPDGQIVSANKAAMEIYGYTSTEQIHKTSVLSHYANSDDRDRLLKIIQEKGVAKGFEALMLRQNGARFWASLNGITQTTESGEKQFIAIVEDITDRKKAEADLARLNEELRSFNLQLEAKVEERTRQLAEAVIEARASNQAKSEFLANMSHELRTPLNAIIGFSQVLDARYFGDLNPKQSEYIKDILESGRHLLSLINDILDLSKIEAGKMELELSSVKIADILRNSLVMIKEKAQAHHIALEVKMAEIIENLEITADERKLKQVMFNLLSNAAKFTPDGGRIEVGAEKVNGELTISVSDTGIGISDKEKGRLFEAFYQASGGIQDKTPGTGLGLKITKTIIEKHGGQIWVNSEGPGKGSCFSFTLPG